jgi:hypothetical protein
MDFNMMTGRALGLILFNVSSRPDSLPSSIQNVQTRARLVDDINNALGPHIVSYKNVPAFKGQISALPQPLFDPMVNDVNKIIEKQIDDINDSNTRNGVGFLLWSGCLSAAKVIAMDTLDGMNTSELRTDSFTNLIDPLCKLDELFKAGVETAPVWKSLKNQKVSFEGVPADSPVRVHEHTPYQN